VKHPGLTVEAMTLEEWKRITADRARPLTQDPIGTDRRRRRASGSSE